MYWEEHSVSSSKEKKHEHCSIIFQLIESYVSEIQYFLFNSQHDAKSEAAAEHVQQIVKTMT